jgi:hypothetical protein
MSLTMFFNLRGVTCAEKINLVEDAFDFIKVVVWLYKNEIDI